ncbi:MAG: tetratricopeptide repeat protein [Sphaerospermopsis sp. SIO1G1]|nr:tetratricopeptide repeat protein [Sphaerospermopsis sp. SIO1G1]
MVKSITFLINTIILWSLFSALALGENKNLQQMDRFPPSPLEVTTDDPLVRSSVKQQPLTAEELVKLETDLDRLNQQATSKFQEGDKQNALDIWNRELRLRRFLGLQSEVEALSRVGEITWRENEGRQVIYITQRLQSIDKQMITEKNTNLQLWQSLAQAYQKIRVPKLAILAYEQVLSLVKQQKNIDAEIDTLTVIGNLHLSRFNYSQAATTYQQLLNIAISRSDKIQEVEYLQELIYIYNRGEKRQKAIKVLSQLATIYRRNNNVYALLPLKIAIAENYQSLAQENPKFLQSALNNYQEAYVTAWNSKSYVFASEALQKLTELYRDQNQIDEAIQTSQILLETQTLTNNSYGLMQAYDQIGQLYLEKQDNQKALLAFQNGLEIATKIQYQEEYFTQKVGSLSNNKP